MIEALRVVDKENLLPLSQLLYRAGIAHRISEYHGDQVVWVKNEADIPQVRALYKQLPELSLKVASLNGNTAPQTRIVPWSLVRRQLLRSPTITSLILMSSFVTLGLNTGWGELIFSSLQMSLSAVLQGQVWRLVTPVFLHFNLMHLVFNMLMLWVFGRQVEARETRRSLITLLLLTAVASNFGQYMSTGGGFGGMSGVVYGVMAFCWQWDRMNPQRPYGFPPALMGFMLFWLLLGYTDMLAWAGFGHMANSAHLIGLACGLISAFILSLLRIPGNRGPRGLY